MSAGDTRRSQLRRWLRATFLHAPECVRRSRTSLMQAAQAAGVPATLKLMQRALEDLRAVKDGDGIWTLEMHASARVVFPEVRRG